MGKKYIYRCIIILELSILKVHLDEAYKSQLIGFFSLIYLWNEADKLAF
jgi:hypothetical protein